MALKFGTVDAFHETNLATYQINKMKTFGDKVALIDAKTEKYYTYADVVDKIQRCAAGLRDLGLRHGDVLCMMTYNHIDYHIVWYAANLIGATFQTIVPSYPDDELIRRFKECKTKFLITTPDQIKRVSAILHTLKSQAVSISIPRSNILIQIITYGGHVDGYVPYESLMSRGRITESVKIDPGKDVSILLSSSGTTGLPKHVMLTHRNMVANIPQLQEAFQEREGMVTIICLALFHHYGVHSCMNPGLNTGLKTIIMERYNIDLLLEMIQKYKPQILKLVPPMILDIIKHPNLHQYDLSSLKYVCTAAAPFGIELEKAAKKILNLGIFCQAYGLTETGFSTGNGPKAYKEGSVGTVPDGVKLKIADIETGKSLPRNEIGEILVAGPQITIGYLNKPEYSKTCFDEEGYIKTGDLGYIDSDGFLFYKDRLKELIKYKATQVAPAFLEDILKKHPRIKDAAVVGIPDEEAGELPKAFIIKQDGNDITANEIHEYMRSKVASYMRLRGGIEFTDNIPKTPSGKILRRLLKQQNNKAKL